MTTVTHVLVPQRLRTRVSSFGFFGWFAILLGLAFLVIFAIPVFSMIVSVVFPKGESAADVWSRTFGGRGVGIAIRNTAILVVVVNLIAVPLGLFFAWVTERTDGSLGWISRILPVLPILLPPVSLSVGWLILTNPRAGFLDHWLRSAGSAFGFDSSGWSFHLEGWGGLILVYVVFVIPTVYILGVSAFQNTDASIEEAARVYRSGVMRCFFRISLPAIKPAIGASVVLVSIASAELYSIPAIMGTPARVTTISVYIAQLIRGTYPPKLAEAVSLGFVVAVFLLTLWFMQRRLNARGHHAQIEGGGLKVNKIALGKFRWVARTSLVGYVLIGAVLPFLALVLVSLERYWTATVDWTTASFDSYREILNDPMNKQALVNSLTLGATTGIIVVAVALVLTVYATFNKGGVSESLSVVTKLPAGISTLVLSVGVILVYAASPFDLGGTLYILLIVFLLTRMTNASIVIEGGVAQIGRSMLEASSMAGAGMFRTFARVLLPLCLPALAIAWVFAFAHTVGDLTASVFLAGPRNPTLGYQIQKIYDNSSYTSLAALSIIVALISAIAVTVVLRLGRARFTSN